MKMFEMMPQDVPKLKGESLDVLYEDLSVVDVFPEVDQSALPCFGTGVLTTKPCTALDRTEAETVF